MSTQFLTTFDECGDLSVRAGWVIAKDGPAIRVGPRDIPAPPKGQRGDITALESRGVTYIGGSGRNLLVSGIPGTDGYNGVWRHGYPGKWHRAALVLVHVTGGSTKISDGTDFIAELASGGPVGSLASTAYGDGIFGGSFTVVVAAEPAAPGVIPGCRIASNAAVLPAGDFTALDAANFEFDADPLLTISIAEDGEASLIYDGVVIAIRAEGENNNPEGDYLSTVAGLEWNPTPADDPGTTLTEVNPFGVLTIIYSWPATPDLDDTTTFLGASVGFPGPYTADFMTHSGDDTGPTGSETVVIDLAAAWAAGNLGDVADILCMADWYPGAGGSGPATLDVTYSLPGSTPLSIAMRPGGASPASTVVAAIRVLADGSFAPTYSAWEANVQRLRVPPPAGVIYVQGVEVAAVLDEVTGPSFDTTLPANTATEFHLALSESDGAGIVEQVRMGVIEW